MIEELEREAKLKVVRWRPKMGGPAMQMMTLSTSQAALADRIILAVDQRVLVWAITEFKYALVQDLAKDQELTSLRMATILERRYIIRQNSAA